MSGQQFGDLTVLEYNKEKSKLEGRSFWKCRCVCGVEKSIRSDQLTSGSTKSCGCLAKRIKRYKDIAGDRFGRLMALQPMEERAANGGMKWLCKCDCGNQTVVEAHNLQNGTTRSCGCLAKENLQENARRQREKRKDLTSLQFGKLIVLKDTGKIDNQLRHFWLCQCECGNILEVRDSSLTSGNTNSCGCHYSKGEAVIQKILQENNIEYEKEKTFGNLKGEKGWAYRYDFYLPDYNRLIEYDGEQHFDYTGSGWNTKENFEKVQQSDKVKNEYAQNHSIDLVRIPYMELKNISLNMILGEQYLIPRNGNL